MRETIKFVRLSKDGESDLRAVGWQPAAEFGLEFRERRYLGCGHCLEVMLTTRLSRDRSTNPDEAVAMVIAERGQEIEQTIDMEAARDACPACSFAKALRVQGDAAVRSGTDEAADEFRGFLEARGRV